MGRTVRRAIWLTIAVWPQLAGAAGFYFGENGAKALSMGGAFTAQADDLTAIEHNPAGLARQNGFSFLVDAQLLSHQVGFLRKDPQGATTTANEVHNEGGLFFLPNVGLGKSFLVGGQPFTLAFGVYGPPTVGRYQYPTPNYDKDENGRYLSSPRKSAPQRYTLIKSDVIILYPSLAAAYQVRPRVAVGASLQYVVSRFQFSRAIYSGLSTPTSQRDEDPIFDSIVSVDLQGKGSFTGILGVQARPTDTWWLGASVRPPVPIHAEGKMVLELGEAARGLKSQVVGDRSDLDLTLPLEARVGAHWQTTAALGLNLDLVYQGWQSVQEYLLTPREMTLQVASGPPTPVEPIHIVKRWHASWSGRLGGAYAVTQALTVRAGALFETAAAPEEQTDIDFLHFTRLIGTAGLGYQLGALEVLGGFAFAPTLTQEVTTSGVRAISTDPQTPGGIVGLGTYSSGGWVGTLGVRGRFE